MSLENQTAIVTGGGTGIGAAVAIALAAAGCRVVISGRREAALQKTVETAESENMIAIAADVGDRAEVDQLIDSTMERFGRIDILVNSAGVNTQKRNMADLSLEDWQRILRINATGAFNCIQASLPAMREQRSGTIINISSVAGLRAGLLGGVAYNASKFAMSALGITAGEEEREQNIRVTNIYPGEVETPILDDRPVPVTAEHRARILQPDDVADAVMMVCRLPSRARVPELVIIPTTQSYI